MSKNQHRWYSQWSCPAALLGYLHPQHSLRQVASARHPIPEFVQQRFFFPHHLLQRYPVDTGHASVAPHPLVRIPKYSLRDFVWLCPLELFSKILEGHITTIGSHVPHHPLSHESLRLYAGVCFVKAKYPKKSYKNTHQPVGNCAWPFCRMSACFIR